MKGPDETRTSRTVALIAITMSSFLTPMALSSVNVALPTMAKELAMDALSLSWVATIYMVVAAAFLVPIGRLADIIGRKKIFLFGTGVFTVASFLLGVAPTTAMLIAFRAIQGVGGSMVFATGVAILTSVYPATERGKVFGINVAAVYLGLSTGPFLGGIFTQYMGWRSVFFMNVPLGIAIIYFCVWKLREEWAHAKGESYDLVGSLIYSAMLIAIMYGFSLLPEREALAFIIPGMAATIAFVLWEKKTESPIINVGIFVSNRVFALSNIAALISYSATYAVGFLLSLYLQQIKALSPTNAGIILVSQPIVQAFFSPLAGKMSDRIEPRFVATIGMAVTAAGLFFLCLIEATTPTWFIVGDLVVLGLGFALFSSPNTNAIMGSVETKLYGVASSMLSTMRLLGQMFSMGIAMLLFAVYIGRVEIAPAHYPLLMKSVRTAFLIFGFMCVAGIYASFVRGNLRPNGERQTSLTGNNV